MSQTPNRQPPIPTDAACWVPEAARAAARELLRQMLPEAVEEGRRILVFSQFTSMLALIEAELAEMGLEYVKLTGRTRDRERPVRRFQEAWSRSL